MRSNLTTLTAGTRLRSSDGLEHVLHRRIGAGGQGEVWLTEGKRRIVKVCYDSRHANEQRRQFAFVKSLPLEKLHVARPVGLLVPPMVGYVAEFLSEMVPMGTLLMPARGVPLPAWHRESGGLRRRLRLLAHAAEALSGLHEIGVSYGDLSDTNVMISADRAFSEAWLIDLDNVRHKTSLADGVFTPHYAAPELERRTGSTSSLTDAWSFAVLACWVLTLGHPFIGDRVDEDAELEAAALAAELPWVGDSDDPSNPTTRGLPIDMVLSAGLRGLAKKTFGRTGRATPAARATVGEWATALHAAADRTITCQACDATFYDRSPICPWCDTARPSHGRVEFYAWVPEPASTRARGIDERHLRAILSFDRRPDATTTVSERQTHLTLGLAGRQPTLHLQATARGVQVTPADGSLVWLQDRAPSRNTAQSGFRHLPARGAHVGAGDQWLHFGPEDQPHRVAVIKEVPR